MIVKLLTEHHLEFLSLKEAAEARPSLHLSKCQIVGNLMSRLLSYLQSLKKKKMRSATTSDTMADLMYKGKSARKFFDDEDSDGELPRKGHNDTKK